MSQIVIQFSCEIILFYCNRVSLLCIHARSIDACQLMIDLRRSTFPVVILERIVIYRYGYFGMKSFDKRIIVSGGSLR